MQAESGRQFQWVWEVQLAGPADEMTVESERKKSHEKICIITEKYDFFKKQAVFTSFTELLLFFFNHFPSRKHGSDGGGQGVKCCQEELGVTGAFCGPLVSVPIEYVEWGTGSPQNKRLLGASPRKAYVLSN